MKETTLSIPEVGLIALTRGMLGAGIALLVAGKLNPERRKRVGLPLALIGGLSTIPLIMRAAKNLHERTPPLARS